MNRPSNDKPRAATRVVSFSGEARDAGKLAASIRELRIPELYRRPMGDRDTQGCLKARA